MITLVSTNFQLTDNLQAKIPANVKADWGTLGLMSHSASADYFVEMLYQNSTFAKVCTCSVCTYTHYIVLTALLQAVAFLEPDSGHFTKPLGYSIPALSYGTQFCMEKQKCCIEGRSYLHFYGELTCPKIMMNVTVCVHVCLPILCVCVCVRVCLCAKIITIYCPFTGLWTL